MDWGNIAAQAVALLLGAVGGGLFGGLVSLVVAGRTERAATAQLKLMQEQLAAAQRQLDEAKRQFLASNTPDIEIKVYVQINPPEKRGVWLKATNHHPTITVNDLRVYAVGDSPSEKEAFTFMFTTFADLKPMQSTVERSLQDLEPTLKKHFREYDSSGAFISDTPMGGSFDSFPMKVHFSFLPRFAGAQKSEYIKDSWFSVMREKGA